MQMISLICGYHSKLIIRLGCYIFSIVIRVSRFIVKYRAMIPLSGFTVHGRFVKIAKSCREISSNLAGFASMKIFRGRSGVAVLKVVAAVQLLAVGLGLAAMMKDGDDKATRERTYDAIVGTAALVAPVATQASPAGSAGVVSRMQTQLAVGQKGAMLPARLLNCSLGRITNFDKSRVQAPSEYTFEGRHPFKLFLPSIAARTTPPPDVTAPAEPVDPNTKIVDDPDGIAKEVGGRAFDRVVDYWPQRVEMTTPISNRAYNLIIIDGVDSEKGLATIFMTNANDAVTFDWGPFVLRGLSNIAPRIRRTAEKLICWGPDYRDVLGVD